MGQVKVYTPIHSYGQLAVSMAVELTVRSVSIETGRHLIRLNNDYQTELGASHTHVSHSLDATDESMFGISSNVCVGARNHMKKAHLKVTLQVRVMHEREPSKLTSQVGSEIIEIKTEYPKPLNVWRVNNGRTRKPVTTPKG